jgi:hypothetical protein
MNRYLGITNNIRASKHKNIFFELYGFDIILDSKLNPWLLEVNISPSLSSSSPLDKKIKTSLMTDIFHLIGMNPFEKKKFSKEQDVLKMDKFLGFKKDIATSNLPLTNNVSNSNLP